MAVEVEIVGRRELATGQVVELRFRAPDGSPLPSWEPGAHIDVRLPSGIIRQYSLCGDPSDLRTWTIAVLRETESRGGSTELHDALAIGDRVFVEGPRNHFPLEEAPHVVFVAGGIGITPLLPMMHALNDRGASWELHFGARSRSSMVYADRVSSLGEDRVVLYPRDETAPMPLEQICRKAPAGSVVYACGPARMIEDAERCGAAAGIPVRFERFGAPPAAEASGRVNLEFTVTLERTGCTLRVPPDATLIDVVREVIPTVPFSCEEGYCGSCETTVLDGIPEHRDSVLSEAERDANESMMICVGRARTSHLVLDL